VQRIYLDNAASSFPKPPGVADAVAAYVAGGGSAGRGAYREAVEAGRLLERTRDLLRKLLGARPADHVVFAFNGSDALNLALKSLLRAGDHVVTTCMEHNSVLRPLSALQSQRGISWTAVDAHLQSSLVAPAAVEQAIGSQTALVVVNHASNVTGAVQNIAAIGEICRRRGLLFLVDAAQSAGHLPIDFSSSPIDLLAAPGHKGLLGPLGTGVLLIRAGLEDRLISVREGGTGSASELPVQPEKLPDKLEAGSHNAVGLAGLRVALEWLLERGVESVRAHELELSNRLTERLDAIAGVTWYGPRESAQRMGVVSFRVGELDPGELSNILEEQFGVLTRSGLHCAPLAHRAIGTFAEGGTTRASFGPFTSAADVDALADALQRIASSTIA
jgi:cysteine desulfurase/selenocysteine lyase